MPERSARFGIASLSGALLVGAALAMRCHNAFDYPVGKGFDAGPNWDYIALLREGWQLPAPDAMWAASHPPLYYWLAGALGLAFPAAAGEALLVPWIRLFGSAFGVAAILAGALWIRGLDPDPRRVFLAMAVPLLLPVHLYTSAMLNEEIVAAAWGTLALVAVLRSRRGEDPAWARVALVGVLGGLAFLTKVSGVLILVSAAATYAIDGWRGGSLRTGIARAGLVLCVGGLLGGWFFAHNLWVYGYLYPFKLDVHAIMATMPPGERSLSDYFSLPLASFLQPVVLGPELVRSVWGGTYATLWFDAHHHFLPRPTPGLVQWGALLTLLGILPTLAFGVGVVRGVRRVRKSPAAADLPILLTLGITLAGYVAFTWRNPWFATTKASYLLALTLPFAYYASEVLADWTRPRNLLGWTTRVALASLAVIVVLTFSHGLLFAKLDDPGVQWRMLPATAPG